MKKPKPPTTGKVLPDLTAPKYPPGYFHGVPKKKDKAGGWGNQSVNSGSPGAPFIRGGKVSPR